MKDLEADLRDLFAKALWVEVNHKVNICRDPEDNFILECAWNVKAKVILTGDKDLLSLKSWEGIQILTPRQYVDRPIADVVQ